MGFPIQRKLRAYFRLQKIMYSQLFNENCNKVSNVRHIVLYHSSLVQELPIQARQFVQGGALHDYRSVNKRMNWLEPHSMIDHGIF